MGKGQSQEGQKPPEQTEGAGSKFSVATQTGLASSLRLSACDTESVVEGITVVF